MNRPSTSSQAKNPAALRHAAGAPSEIRKRPPTVPANRMTGVPQPKRSVAPFARAGSSSSGAMKFPVAVVSVQKRGHPSHASYHQTRPNHGFNQTQLNPVPPLQQLRVTQRDVRTSASLNLSKASTPLVSVQKPSASPPRQPDGGINAVDLLGPDKEDEEMISDGPLDEKEEKPNVEPPQNARCALYEAKRVASVQFKTYNDYVAARRAHQPIEVTPIELPTRKVITAESAADHRNLGLASKDPPNSNTLSFLNRSQPSGPPGDDLRILKRYTTPPTFTKEYQNRLAQKRLQEAKSSAAKRAAEYKTFMAWTNLEEREDFQKNLELDPQQLKNIINREVFRIKQYTKKRGRLMFRQCLPLPGPKDPEVYKPSKEWDKNYVKARLPTESDVLKQRRFLKGTSTLRVALRIAQRNAIRALKYEQINRGYKEFLQALGADVRGPRDPPQNTRCPRCEGIWLKVVELNKDWDKKGNRYVKKCLWCNDACCNLILLKDVEWEVGKLYGVPKLEELKFGRSRVEIDSKGKPSKRVHQYLKDLQLYRRLARESGVDLTHKDDFYYTVCAGQKRAIKIV